MQLQNKNRLSYLAALTLLFSYAEMLLPKVVPFFRLGLGNITILLSLNMNLPEYFILCLIKSVAGSLMSGTLFSPFALISLGQSLGSGIAMWLLYRLFRKSYALISVYGISIAGSAVSAVIQIVLSALYLGQGTYALLGPMLLFSLFAAIVTAFLSQKLKIAPEAPVLTKSDVPSKNTASYLCAGSILLCVVIVFLLKNLTLLAVVFVAALILQLISGRKIKLIPYLSLWLFVIVSSLFIPSGKVLFSVFHWNITLGALETGISRALKLSSTMALSQCAAFLRFNSQSIVAETLSYFSGLSDYFKTTQGNLIARIQNTLSATALTEKAGAKKQNRLVFYLLVLAVFIALLLIEKLI